MFGIQCRNSKYKRITNGPDSVIQIGETVGNFVCRHWSVCIFFMLINLSYFLFIFVLCASVFISRMCVIEGVRQTAEKNIRRYTLKHITFQNRLRYFSFFFVPVIVVWRLDWMTQNEIRVFGVTMGKFFSILFFFFRFSYFINLDSASTRSPRCLCTSFCIGVRKSARVAYKTNHDCRHCRD